MPRRKIKTRVIREILRLRSLGCSVREICRSVNASVGSISALIRRAGKVDLRWPVDLRQEGRGSLTAITVGTDPHFS